MTTPAPAPRATVVALAERGASIVIADRDEDGAHQTVALTGQPDRVAFRVCDVADGRDLAAAIDSAEEMFGRLDIAANTAGIGDGDLFAGDPGAWRQVIDINLTALIDSTRLAVRTMGHGGHGGAIINLASWAGLYPMAASPVYSAAKAGVVSFTRALAGLAASSSIRVNAICPELVELICRCPACVPEPTGADVATEGDYVLRRSTGWPVTAAIISKSLSRCRHVLTVLCAFRSELPSPAHRLPARCGRVKSAAGAA